MRLVLSCLQSQKKHPVPAYDFWRGYFVNGAQEAGWECLEIPLVDWAEGLTYTTEIDLSAWRARSWEQVLAFVKKEISYRPIDLFLSYLYPKQIHMEAILDLQRLGIPCVNFFCDNVREFRKVPKEFHCFDLNWVPEFEALKMYQQAHLPYMHAPMPCWVPPELRTVPSIESERPTFIGSEDVLRRDLLGRALERGADFFIYGQGWNDDNISPREISGTGGFTRLKNQVVSIRSNGLSSLYFKLESQMRPLRLLDIPADRVKSFVSQSEYIRTLREAQVTIGINRVPTGRASNRRPIKYSRLRDIEAPMLGACYLTEWTSGLEQLYDIDSEIETYRSAEELADKLTKLNQDQRGRRLLRERGQRRALADHSVSRSLSLICDQLSLC